MINDAVCCVDLSAGNCVYVNEKLVQLFQVAKDEFIQDTGNWLNFVYPEDMEPVKQISATNTDFELEHRIVTGTEIKWVRHSHYLIRNQNGELALSVRIFTDITKQKEIEVKCAEQEKITNDLFHNNPNPLWIYDKTTFRFLAVNYAAVMHYGYSKEEFLSMTIFDIRPDEEMPRLTEAVRKNSMKFTQSQKWRHRKKDKSIIYVNITGHEIMYAGRKAEFVLAHDITQEILAHEELLAAKNNLDAVINNTQDLIWSIDKEYRIISVNHAFKNNYRSIFGTEITIGDSIFKDESSEHIRNQWKKKYDRALAGEAFLTVEDLNYNDTLTTSEIRYNPILKEDRQVVGVGCFSRDITEMMQTQQELMDQNQRLKEIASFASHDVRGPVASLMGLVQLFNRENPQDPFNENIISSIETVTRQLDTVIHKIVDKTYPNKQKRESKD